MEMFAKLCCKRGYAIRVVGLDHGVWTEVPRGRIFIIGMGKSIGHSKAADWMVHNIRESEAYRKLLRPVPVFDIVDPDGVQETQRRENAVASKDALRESRSAAQAFKILSNFGQFCANLTPKCTILDNFG